MKSILLFVAYLTALYGAFTAGSWLRNPILGLALDLTLSAMFGYWTVGYYKQLQKRSIQQEQLGFLLLVTVLMTTVVLLSDVVMIEIYAMSKTGWIINALALVVWLVLVILACVKEKPVKTHPHLPC